MWESVSPSHSRLFATPTWLGKAVLELHQGALQTGLYRRLGGGRQRFRLLRGRGPTLLRQRTERRAGTAVVVRFEKALAWEEGVFEAVTHQLLQVGIAQIPGTGRADELERQVRALDALVVGIQGDWDAGASVEQEGMPVPHRAQD